MAAWDSVTAAAVVCAASSSASIWPIASTLPIFAPGTGKMFLELLDTLFGLGFLLESGRTLAYAKDLLMARGARRVMTSVLLDKSGRRAAQIEADFKGFDCPDKFVVGFGMDMGHAFRELPFVGYVVRE